MLRRILTLSLALAPTLTGCLPIIDAFIPADFVTDSRGTALVIIDPDFTIDEHNAIVRALDVWNEAANGNYVFQLTPFDVRMIANMVGKDVFAGRCFDVIPIDRYYPIHLNIAELDEREGAPVLGFAIHDECVVSPVGLVPFRIDDMNILTWVTMHELGHAVGLDHVEDPGALMYGAVGNTSRCTEESCCIPRSDMAQLCDEIGCDVETTHYCAE